MVRKHPMANAQLGREDFSNLGMDLESPVLIRFLTKTDRADSMDLGISVAQHSYSVR